MMCAIRNLGRVIHFNSWPLLSATQPQRKLFKTTQLPKIYCSFHPFPYCPFQQSFYTHLNIAVMENFGLSEKLGRIKNNSEIYLKNV